MKSYLLDGEHGRSFDTCLSLRLRVGVICPSMAKLHLRVLKLCKYPVLKHRSCLEPTPSVAVLSFDVHGKTRRFSGNFKPQCP
ncbi:hypothetical protein HMPREF9554_02449 [Treponema phagedenis F0421]|nr:hypothetical protein HMPREF9554_02449 [Treponema phagedenis F0421]